MHHNIDLILTLTYGLGAALLLGFLSLKIGLSPIVGYLLAGFAIGPYSPGFTANQEVADQFAEVGVILLMFGVGLQFHFDELLRVRRVAIPGAVVQSLVATILGCVVIHFLGWGWGPGIVYGMAISVASTVVLLRVLADAHHLHTPTGHIAVGWLVVEDLFTVLMLVLLPVIFGEGETTPSGLIQSLVWSLAKIGALVLFTIFIGGRVIPWLLTRVAATRSRELFTLTVLAVALGIAVGSSQVFGVSMALGAFLAGMIVGRSEFSLRAASEALPMRDAFAVLFFVSVGMLFQPSSIVTVPGLIVATLAIVLIGKPLAALAIMSYLKYPLKSSLSVAAVLAQIGEFSFIVVTLGMQLGILDESITNAVVAAAIVSISVNPFIYSAVGPLEKFLMRSPLLSRWFQPKRAQTEEGLAEHDSGAEEVIGDYEAVVIGYGPVGRTMVRLLKDSGIQSTVIELNLKTVRQLRELGIRAVYGDATHRDTIEAAGTKRAIALIIGAAGLKGSAEIIRLARDVNPSIRVFVRTDYLHEAPALREAGADVVFAAEGEVALGMTESVLRQLGATAEQIDRERDHIRNDLFGRELTSDLVGTLKS